jgi:hypothetical protein
VHRSVGDERASWQIVQGRAGEVMKVVGELIEKVAGQAGLTNVREAAETPVHIEVDLAPDRRHTPVTVRLDAENPPGPTAAPSPQVLRRGGGLMSGDDVRVTTARLGGLAVAVEGAGGSTMSDRADGATSRALNTQMQTG